MIKAFTDHKWTDNECSVLEDLISAVSEIPVEQVCVIFGKEAGDSEEDWIFLYLPVEKEDDFKDTVISMVDYLGTSLREIHNLFL